MAEAKLYYFDGRGLGEKIRIMLCVAGIQFEDVSLQERATLVKLMEDGDLMFDQLPLLEMDGLKLVQANACVRYVAARSNLYSTDPKIAAKIDMLYDGTRDFYSIFIQVFLRITEEEVCKTVEEKTLPRYLPVFEKVLKDNGTGYLVGNSVTMADAGLLEPLLAIEDYMGTDRLKDFPNLTEFLKKMKSLDGVKVYLEKYRKRKNDARYSAEVMKVLGMTSF